MKVAYFCEPQVGGTFTFFKELRKGLLKRQIDLRCIPPVSATHYKNSKWDKLEGVDYIEFPAEDMKESTRILIDYLVNCKFDIVIALTGCEPLSTNLVRYLPPTIRSLGRIPMATHGMYRIVKTMANHFDHFVAVCDRIRKDLTKDYHLSPDRITVIENGADTTLFAGQPRLHLHKPVRLIYCGRLEEVQKNILLIPEIARILERFGINASFTIVGQGPDKIRLQQTFQRRASRTIVNFFETLDHDELPDYYASHDIFILPSRFEGTPNALLEGMAMGCVPIVTRIAGSTDAIIADGINGYLVRMGDADAFALKIKDIVLFPEKFAQMSIKAIQTVCEKYSLDIMTDSYYRLLIKLASSPPGRVKPNDLDTFNVPRVLLPSWRRFVPTFIKRWVRTWFGRRGRTI